MPPVAKLRRIDRFKNHIKKHKIAYSIGGVIVIAGITCVIVRSNVLHSGTGVSILPSGVTNTASQFFTNRSTINVITVLEREGRGHPGYPVRNLETMRTFLKQADAAEWANASESILSTHLQGKIPDVNGLHFERVSLPTM